MAGLKPTSLMLFKFTQNFTYAVILARPRNFVEGCDKALTNCFNQKN